MKLYDPETERELLHLATLARRGKEMQPEDPGKPWTSIVMTPLALAAIFFIPAMALGAFDLRLREEHWQTLVVCFTMMWAAQLHLGMLISLFMQDGYHAVCANLPIRGEHAFRWVRSRFIIRQWLPGLALASLCGFAVHGFSPEQPWHVAATSLLLFASGAATTILFNERSIAHFKIGRIWTLGSLLLAISLFLHYVGDGRIYRMEETPNQQWMADAILTATWLLPPSWCLPGRLESGGAILTVLWTGLGIARWRAWPKESARYLDARRDFAEAFGHFASDEYEDDDDDEYPDHPLRPADESVYDADAIAGISSAVVFKVLPPPPALPEDSPVGRWVRRWIAKGDEPVAGTFCDGSSGWTFRMRWTLLVLPPWLLLVWAFVRFFPESDLKETGMIWVWMLSILLPLAGLLPFSNAIPNALTPWITGAQSFPIFSALPVPIRRLLRVSVRITFARCVLMSLIGTPYAIILAAILLPDASPLLALWLVPAFCFFWITARPMFVWYRLQALNQRKRGIGTLFLHVVLVMLNVILGLISLVAATFGILTGLAYIEGGVSGDDLWQLPLAAVGGLLLSAIFSRAVFEIYHWQLSRRHLDWITSG